MPREWLRLSSPVPYVDCSDPALEAREQATNQKKKKKKKYPKTTRTKEQARRLSLFLCHVCSNGL